MSSVDEVQRRERKEQEGRTGGEHQARDRAPDTSPAPQGLTERRATQRRAGSRLGSRELDEERARVGLVPVFVDEDRLEQGAVTIDDVIAMRLELCLTASFTAVHVRQEPDLTEALVQRVVVGVRYMAGVGVELARAGRKNSAVAFFVERMLKVQRASTRGRRGAGRGEEVEHARALGAAERGEQRCSASRLAPDPWREQLRQENAQGAPTVPSALPSNGG